MSECAALRRDPWLSSVLDRPCGVLDGALADKELPGLVRSSGLDFISVKVSPEEVATLVRLEDAGFRLVDTLVTFAGSPAPAARPRRKGTTPSDLASARPARPEDRVCVERIAGESLVLSRFHLDPALGIALGRRVKQAWVANFFAGARGDAMCVVEAEGAVRGFLLALHDRAAARLAIDLIAVDPAWQGRGLGQLLVRGSSAAWPAAREAVAGTQLANAGSHRFYQSLGWTLTRATHVLHWHRGRRAA